MVTWFTAGLGHIQMLSLQFINNMLLYEGLSTLFSTIRYKVWVSGALFAELYDFKVLLLPEAGTEPMVVQEFLSTRCTSITKCFACCLPCNDGFAASIFIYSAYQLHKQGARWCSECKPPVLNSDSTSRDEFFSPKILTDLSISYTPKKWLTITAGANNILDAYPDPVKNPLNKNQGVLIYSNEGAPFGYNGEYYFLSMGFSW